MGLSILDDPNHMSEYVGHICIALNDYNELVPLASILARAKK